MPMPQRTAAPCSSTSAPSPSGRPTAQSPERCASLATCSSGGWIPPLAIRTRRRVGLDRHVVLMCNEGYQSSLAAATLQTLGFARATDVVGGFQAWRDAGLPARLDLPEPTTSRQKDSNDHEDGADGGPIVDRRRRSRRPRVHGV